MKFEENKITEKRFELAYEKGNWWAVRDGDITLWKEEVIDTLNTLSNENERLKQREERLVCEIEDFQELLTKNDNVCHKKVLQLLDDKISFLYKAKADMIEVDEYRYEQIAFAIQCLRELRKELEE